MSDQEWNNNQLGEMKNRKDKFAFGWPGIEPRWTSSAKSGVGTAYNAKSKVWYSISHGILNEIYYPQVDQACTRDLSLIVTDGKDFFSEEKKDTSHHIKHIAKNIPGYHITNSCNYHYYRIEKEIISDSSRDALLQRIQFFPTNRKRKDFKMFVLLAPHLGNNGSSNTAWVGDYKGVPMLFAQRGDASLALACSVPWKKASAGFVGVSDGWQDLNKHKDLLWEFERAENGNVALTGEVNLEECSNYSFVLSLGFGRNPEEAGMRARASLFENFDNCKAQFIAEWQKWQKKLYVFDNNSKRSLAPKYFNISATMLRVHESKRHPGGLIASLSIPWGFSRGDHDLGGYHLVWPRDMVQTAGGLLGARAFDDARRVLNYLMVTQEGDGHWVQNMWLDGEPYWNGVQMDQTALPIMLVDLVNRECPLTENDLRHFWPMMRRAAGFLVGNGPITHQDRWEENAGYSTFTLAVEVCALLVAADYAELNHEPQLAKFLRETADSWNSCIERWTYVEGSDLARFVGVDGYYVRINAQESFDSEHGNGLVTISNRPRGENICPASEMVSPDALALVRYGLRSADDPRILNTIKVIDATLKMDHPQYGPVWYRYNRDGYGETVDGRPFQFFGIGRPWPLLTGERGHYEVAAGNIAQAEKLLKTLENYANETGLFPEQVWDSDDIPELGLFYGKPTGAAMPLAWAHSEYIKLCRSIKGKRVFDMPRQSEQRYLIDKVTSNKFIWNFKSTFKFVPKGRVLRVHVLACATVRWTTDGWQTTNEIVTLDSGVGVYFAELPTAKLDHGQSFEFTFFWHDANKPEGKNFKLTIERDKSKVEADLSELMSDRDKIKVFLPS